MSIMLETDSTVFFAGIASLFDDERDVASDWAGQHIKTNKYIKWVIGKYVEADKVNNNGQYWTLKDLQNKHTTVDHTPMNMGHRPHDIVGTVVASEMIYPDRSDMNPYVETVAAFWKWYRPEELKKLEEAYSTGNAWQSMEAVSDTVTCVGPEGCGETFDYAGPNSDTYCSCIQNHRGHKQLDNPHFLGSGLIIPPDRPGWSNADINSIARHTTDEQKHEMLVAIADAAPHLSSSEWEKVMWALQFEAFSNENAVVESKKTSSEIARVVASQFLASSRY